MREAADCFILIQKIASGIISPSISLRYVMRHAAARWLKENSELDSRAIVSRRARQALLSRYQRKVRPQ